MDLDLLKARGIRVPAVHLKTLIMQPPDSSGVPGPLRIPARTRFVDGRLEAPGDVELGAGSRIAFAIDAEGAVLLACDARVGGAVRAKGFVHLAPSSRVEGDVTGRHVRVDAGARILGHLLAEERADVDAKASVRGGHASLGLEESLPELPREPLRLPAGVEVGEAHVRLAGGLEAGEGCVLVGDWDAQGDVVLGPACVLHGTLRTPGRVTLGEGVEVHGGVEAGGEVVLGARCRLHGALAADRVVVLGPALLDGGVQAPNGVEFAGPP